MLWSSFARKEEHVVGNLRYDFGQKCHDFELDPPPVAVGLMTKLQLLNSSFNITCSCQSGEQEGELIVCCRQQDPTRQWEANV